MELLFLVKDSRWERLSGQQSVQQVGDKILQASLSRAGSNSNRILIGAVRKIVVGDIYAVSFDFRSSAAELQVVDVFFYLSVARKGNAEEAASLALTWTYLSLNVGTAAICQIGVVSDPIRVKN